MPPELQAFHGRWVTMTGNLFIPYPAARIERFIVARNPWDGCCFGMPPTVWDSIVVRLRENWDMPDAPPRLITVSGRFHIQVEREPKSGLVTQCFELRDAVLGQAGEPPAGSFPWVPAAAGAAALLAAAALLKNRLAARRK
jgi:hypothetical protein